MTKTKITLLPHTSFLKYNGTFDRDTALLYQAKLAGECYTPEGWQKLKMEDDEKSLRRKNMTLGNEHQTPYEHVTIGMEITNLPKIVAMVLNNEKQYSTSEKSERYTEINEEVDENISKNEVLLYKKWLDIFTMKIEEKYPDQFKPTRIKKLAQENARYLVSVFVTTKMIHTVPWIQLNRICSYMQDYIDSHKNSYNNFESRLCDGFNDFIYACNENNLLEDVAMSNRKHRELSLFKYKNINNDEFGYSYTTKYKGSFALLAQAQRHRTLSYNMSLDEEPTYYLPPILEGDEVLQNEWIKDIKSVGYANPQGELVDIIEQGTYENFILKCKERLCSAAQLEIANQTKETLEKMSKYFHENNHELSSDIEKYLHGARCTFPDYECSMPCGFKEGIKLTRKI